jgi:plasmid stabilization system protein ParE
MEIRLLDVARQELDDALEYYNAEVPGLGDQFLLEALSTFDRIKEFAKAWHPYTRCQTRRFPYGIVYEILESEILVIAIAHMHRQPGYWRDR